MPGGRSNIPETKAQIKLPAPFLNAEGRISWVSVECGYNSACQLMRLCMEVVQ